MNKDEPFLLQALALAQVRQGFTAPNPAVGALVVKDGCVIGSGAHFMAGYPHAEPAALHGLSDRALTGATLYVTLEPCSHTGRTPPCTERILKTPIKRVVYGCADPSISGSEALRAAGVACDLLALPEIVRFYQPFLHWLKTGLPFVTLKIAVSQDGKVAGLNGQPIKITGPEVDAQTHQRRLHADAILTTLNTVIADDPQLNARVDGRVIKKDVYVLGRQQTLPTGARLYQTARKVIPLAKDVFAALPEIGRRGVHALWVEAGPTLFHALKPVSQEVIVYRGEAIIGEGISLQCGQTNGRVL